MKFKGKIGVLYYFILLGVSIVFIVSLFNTTNIGVLEYYAKISILGLAEILVVSLTLRNYIAVDNVKMTIYLGLFKKIIYCNDIIQLKETNDSTSSMAMSLDRIEIATAHGRVMVSVKDKKAFIEKLCEYNNQIEYLAN